ncbi:metal ABC transporter solute-binding protein, Zn/Mn family, partial [Escherichia coli]|uniref:metal ABC transporter solute-binding protein, Zn/Mn family n=1 Tax=Escherichia coli TaxID=562 RepID=UPI0015C302E7
NPHACMSPDNALIYVVNIRDSFIKSDPALPQTYSRNANTYKAKIPQTPSLLRKQIAAIPQNHRWMVTSAAPFSSLASHLGLKELYLWSHHSDTLRTPQQ